MLYLEYTPAAPLAGLVRSLWYAQAQASAHGRERILPTGRVQVILNLNRDYLLDCPKDAPAQRMAPALVVGARSMYEIVDCTDMADLIGVVFEPGGFALFARDAVDLFSNRSTPLDDVWNAAARDLRERLLELATPAARLRCMESFLRERLASAVPLRGMQRRAEIPFALWLLSRRTASSVREIARQMGWSERRFSQVFREEVGLAPKTWLRVQRFQRAVQQLYAGVDVRWAELALDCGYYDQAHFANEFRAFSGVDATTYTAQRTQWANHISAE